MGRGRGHMGVSFQVQVSFEGGENILKLIVVELYLKKSLVFK